MDAQTQLEIEAATYRAMRDHFQKRTDVQNIDLMNISGFCRNCLSRWYGEAAATHGVEMTKDESREIVYGMAMSEWKAKYQTEATDAQQADFKTAFAENVTNAKD
jgi:hypothetical protein